MPFDRESLIKAVVVGTVAMVAFTILSWIPCIGLIFACLTLFGYLMIGAAYGHFAKQRGIKPDMMSGAVYGGVAAACSTIIPTVINSFAGSDSAIATSLCLPGVLVIAMFFTFVLGAIGGGLYSIME